MQRFLHKYRRHDQPLWGLDCLLFTTRSFLLVFFYPLYISKQFGGIMRMIWYWNSMHIILILDCWLWHVWYDKNKKSFLFKTGCSFKYVYKLAAQRNFQKQKRIESISSYKTSNAHNSWSHPKKKYCTQCWNPHPAIRLVY